jgi:hypothetical protein
MSLEEVFHHVRFEKIRLIFHYMFSLSIKYTLLWKIWGFRGGGYENWRLLGYILKGSDDGV